MSITVNTVDVVALNFIFFLTAVLLRRAHRSDDSVMLALAADAGDRWEQMAPWASDGRTAVRASLLLALGPQSATTASTAGVRGKADLPRTVRFRRD